MYASSMEGWFPSRDLSVRLNYRFQRMPGAIKEAQDSGLEGGSSDEERLDSRG